MSLVSLLPRSSIDARREGTRALCLTSHRPNEIGRNVETSLCRRILFIKRVWGGEGGEEKRKGRREKRDASNAGKIDRVGDAINLAASHQ